MFRADEYVKFNSCPYDIVRENVEYDYKSCMVKFQITKLYYCFVKTKKLHGVKMCNRLFVPGIVNSVNVRLVLNCRIVEDYGVNCFNFMIV